MKALKPTTAEREKAKDAAYERGWVDSLTAYNAISFQPSGDRYWYKQGWDSCAKYRWQEPANRGRASDPNFRIPRPCR